MNDWGERARLACRFGRRARTIVGQICWLTSFRRDAENGNRDGCAPQTKSNGARGRRRGEDGNDGNRMQADGNSFPVFILGWTIGTNFVAK
jgi:hypothetical protein